MTEGTQFDGWNDVGSGMVSLMGDIDSGRIMHMD